MVPQNTLGSSFWTLRQCLVPISRLLGIALVYSHSTPPCSLACAFYAWCFVGDYRAGSVTEEDGFTGRVRLLKRVQSPRLWVKRVFITGPTFGETQSSLTSSGLPVLPLDLVESAPPREDCRRRRIQRYRDPWFPDRARHDRFQRNLASLV